MGWFSKIFGAGEVVDATTALGNVVDKLFTSDDERAQAELLKLKLLQQPLLVQAEINKIAASHRSRFVAGARPFLLWVCGLGFLMAFVINPIMQWAGLPAIELPLSIMLELTLAMLGLAGLRTYEKVKGISK